MKKRTKPTSRGPKKPARRSARSRKRAIIKVEVPDATPKQLDTLSKFFKAKAVATLGISPTNLITTRQWSTAKRRPR